MDYREVTDFINKAKKFGSRLDLTRIEKLCALLGNPQNKCKFVHIAGTNGKGSTSVFIENVLMQAGYKTGLYTSPFIYEFNERIQINNVPIPDEALRSAMEQVVDATNQMLAQGMEHPTEFELITAVAFLYFAKEQCEIVVLEVGLGGRLDATNVILNPLVSVITSIGYDHTEYLGNTLGEIAMNKCGIIKKDCPVVSYPFQKQEALAVISKTARENSSEFILTDTKDLNVTSFGMDGNQFSYRGVDYKTALVGEYQIYNAVTAINAVETLTRLGYGITTEHIQKGLETAKWPARFEILHKSPIVIADGSHNQDGMAAFLRTAKTCIGETRVICVFGMLKDKAYEKCLQMLSEISDTIIVTEVDNPRTETAEKLAETAEKYFSCVISCAENRKAVAKAKALAEDEDIVLALGSLYMMKNIKDAVKEIF